MEHVGLASYLSKQCTTQARTSISERRQVKQTTSFFVRDVADNDLQSTALDILERLGLFFREAGVSNDVIQTIDIISSMSARSNALQVHV